jgi:hypothetical protein
MRIIGFLFESTINVKKHVGGSNALRREVELIGEFL